jgi:hypothetical protein
MSNVVPAFYERGSSFRTWAYETAMEEGSLRSKLIAEREALLQKIDWDSWNAHQSRRLTLLDHLLGI